MSIISLESRVLGGWQGKSAGGTLGLAAEGKTSRSHFSFYDPVPTVAPPNDDLELQLVWLDRLENHCGTLTPDILANAWLANIHYMWDEYGRARWNLRRGVPSSLSGVYENPFASGMGSPIRSEIWAIIAAGNPDLAAHFARLDSMLDHGAEGIAGEVFFAVVQAMILGGTPLHEALVEALTKIDSQTETRQALEQVFSLFKQKIECWAARDELLRLHQNENFTHAPLDVALTLWALLYGHGDFEKTLLLAVNGGYDTDCTAASAGAILGMTYGSENLPGKWLAPLGNEVTIGPGIIGIRAPTTLQELTERSLSLRGRAQELAPVFPTEPTAVPAPETLPGTVSISAGNASIFWANGELPTEVKAAGKGTWQWLPRDKAGAPFQIVALARAGLQLWIDGELLIECPPGLPYVPATHRAPEKSCAIFHASRDIHEIEVKLNSGNPDQEATVILADASLHLAPWNGETLPYQPLLPPALS